MPPIIKNLAFEGGGVKAIGYIGALCAANRFGLLEKVERTIGTSSGSIMALMIALDYSISEIIDKFNNTNFSSFEDYSYSCLTMARNIQARGLCKGQVLFEWIQSIIEAKLGQKNITFKEVEQLKKTTHPQLKDLYVVVSNISTGYPEVVSKEFNNNWSLALAVKASMAIPGLYKAVKVNGQTYNDGGICLNYPVGFFDKIKYIDNSTSDEFIINWQTLGFKLSDPDKIKVFEGLESAPVSRTTTMLEWCEAVIAMGLNVQDYDHYQSKDRYRTVYCNNLNVSSVAFNINEQTKRDLMQEDKKGVSAYLQMAEKNHDIYNSFISTYPEVAVVHPENNKNLFIKQDEEIVISKTKVLPETKLSIPEPAKNTTNNLENNFNHNKQSLTYSYHVSMQHKIKNNTNGAPAITQADNESKVKCCILM
ncbi:MAG: hypothetical protein JWM09_172 [Francisellaceae bacterium]|nr:hypothetical protein [Francisellaceae bacterium]